MPSGGVTSQPEKEVDGQMEFGACKGDEEIKNGMALYLPPVFDSTGWCEPPVDVGI